MLMSRFRRNRCKHNRSNNLAPITSQNGSQSFKKSKVTTTSNKKKRKMRLMK